MDEASDKEEVAPPADSERDGAPSSGTDEGAASSPGRFGGLTDLFSGRTARTRSRGADARSVTPREIVNGLDERERRFSAAGVVLAIGLVIAGYLTDRHSSVLKVRTAATTLLVAGAIIIVIMIFGVIFRRRALVGFSNFMVGFELITAGNILGVAFLGFGGWLLVRALKRQRQDQATRRPPPGSKASKTASPTPSGPPKASKRYTPPRRPGAAARRR